MTGTISVAEAGRPPTRTQCRVSERFPCDLSVSCQPPSAWRGGDREWPARIRNVSTGGLCLVLRRRFERGTGLAIEVPGAEGEGPSTLLVRVVRVRAEADSCWELGCTFVSPLGEEELQRLVHPEAAAEAEAPADRPFVADVTFRGVLLGGGVVKRLIRKLHVPVPAWPMRAGLVIGLRFRAFTADPVVRVRVDACRAAGDCRVLECTFLDEAPAGLAPRAADLRPKGRAAAHCHS